MKIKPENIDDVVALVAARFRTFGGNRVDRSNPISIALQGSAPQFAAGVDVREVVNCVVELLVEVKKSRVAKGST